MRAEQSMKLIWLFHSVPREQRATVAFVTPSASYTHAQLRGAVARMIRALANAGVRPGHKVVLIPEHDAQAVVFLAAASAIGIQIVMPYNLQDAATAEWASIIATVAPQHVVYLKREQAGLAALQDSCASVIVPEIRLDSPVDDDAPLIVASPDPVENFLVLFSSGTTGKPKAISISESLICTRIASVSGQLGFDGKARVLMSGLMNNTTGVIFSFGALLHGATLVFPEHRVPASWPGAVQRHGITHMMLRPIALRRFVEGARASGADLSSLRTMAYGAAALPRRLLEEARALMPCQWVQGYGLSETFGPFCWLTEEDHARRLYENQVYCVGKPDATLEVALRYADADHGGVGEVIVRGAALMNGYLDIASGAVEPVGAWFATGDYGQFTPNGELVLKGRVANTILSENGHRIYPEEVEGVLSGIAGVDDVLLLNSPSALDLGSSPIACIHGALAERGGEEVRAIVLRQLSGRLSEEKWPDYLYLSSAPFPKSDNDKIIKTAVLGMIAAGALIKLTHTESVQ
ncbi:long-chain fatty acid--CoA ligase [Oxalobacteraceae bacterium]|nr:long-chain fatty acid--CoA ligase [Oxalobacteraceae bacterium]